MLLRFRIAMVLSVLGAVGPSAHAAQERVDELLQTTMNLEPNLARGRALYERECSACHGPNAFGNAEQLVPALAGQRRAYLIKQLADFTELDRIATQMHRVVARKAFREPQSWMDVASYLNGLPVNVTPETGNGEMVSLGEALFDQWCASCHEVDARGDDDGFV